MLGGYRTLPLVNSIGTLKALHPFWPPQFGHTPLPLPTPVLFPPKMRPCNPSQNMLRPMLHYLLLCCSCKQATSYSRIGQNVNPPPYKAMLCPKSNVVSIFPPNIPTTHQHCFVGESGGKSIQSQTFVRDCGYATGSGVMTMKRENGKEIDFVYSFYWVDFGGHKEIKYEDRYRP